MKILFAILIVIVLCAPVQCSSDGASRRIDTWQQIEDESWLK